VKYYCSDGLNLLERYNLTTDTQRTFAHGPAPIAGIGNMVQFTESGGSYAFHYDHRGSVFDVTDASQTVAQHYEHDAWGVRLASEGDLENPLQYQACAWLRSPDLPGVCVPAGRWWCKERSSVVANRYTFAASSPVLFSDPDGLVKRYFDTGVRKVLGREVEIEKDVRLLLREYYITSYLWKKDEDGAWCCYKVEFLASIKRSGRFRGVGARPVYRILELRDAWAKSVEEDVGDVAAGAVLGYYGGKGVEKLGPLGAATKPAGYVSNAVSAAQLLGAGAILGVDLYKRRFCPGYYAVVCRFSSAIVLGYGPIAAFPCNA